MSLIYKHITGSDAVTLAEATANDFPTLITTISFCNIHATDSVDIDLYYSWSTFLKVEENNWDGPEEVIDNHYILKSVTIPQGVTLSLSSEDFEIYISNDYTINIKLSASDSAVDVIINTK